MAATRVYILAKELGVKSTAIVKKCQDEGLDVKNHMSWISAGLTATIREWFSEGEHATAIETAEKVDLKKVRAPRRKRKKAAAAKAEEPEAPAEKAVAVAEAPAEEVKLEEAAAVEGEALAVEAAEVPPEVKVEPSVAPVPGPAEEAAVAPTSPPVPARISIMIFF